MTNLEQAFHDAILRTDFEFVPPTLPDDAQPGITIPAELAHTRDRVSAGTDSAR